MKHLICLVAFALVSFFIQNPSFGQGMAINTTGMAADSSSILDVSCTNKGMLVPRMTTSQRTGISSPATGLLVYDSTLASFYYNSGTPASPSWTPLGSTALPAGSAGNILYNNGSTWLPLAPGSNDQVLTMVAGVPAWHKSGIEFIVSSAGANGTITPSDSTAVLYNGSQTFIITPGAGSGIADVTVDGASVGQISSYTFNAVSSNHTINASFLAVGSSYGGGVIAYILQPGDPGYSSTVTHGLIAATSDQGCGFPWSPTVPVMPIGATGTAIGTGFYNSNIIGGYYGFPAAAIVAWSYGVVGYPDWYLPSRDELNKLYINRAAIGGFASSFYWSSSEGGAPVAYALDFSSGNLGPISKTFLGCVRAIRSF